MKVLLMDSERDFDPGQEPRWGADAVRQDLELDVVLDAMGDGDDFVRQMCDVALLSGSRDVSQVRHRQQVLDDALAQPGLIEELYLLAGEAMDAERHLPFGYLRSSPDGRLHRGVHLLERMLALLRHLREIADERSVSVTSDGLRAFFATVQAQLDDGYLDTIAEHLKRLQFRDGVHFSAKLGRAARGTDYVLRQPATSRGLLAGLSMPWDHSEYTYRIPDRDENGHRAVADLRDHAIVPVAEAVDRATRHIVGFFAHLRCETAFYQGCLNLHRRLVDRDGAVCVPTPDETGGLRLAATGLYDVALRLTTADLVVGNDIEADGDRLVMITGANRGGKSTFLRALGQAQLMLQAGLFVAAETCAASVTTGVFTHFRREEDTEMRSGKLDEELQRMSQIVDHIAADGLLLCNESFASTNEREGSEIARHAVRALLDGGVRVLYVTHLFELADAFQADAREDVLFLRAERTDDGQRTFRLTEAPPLETSFGADVYARVFPDRP